MGRFQTERKAGAWKALLATPAYAFAMFVHLLLLVALSFWTIAVVITEEQKSIEVRLSQTKKVVPVTKGLEQEQVALDVLMDASDRDLQTVSESDTDDLFNEARGIASGEVNVFGVGGGGKSGVGRGGNQNSKGGASKSSRGSLEGGLEWLVRHRNRKGLWVAMVGKNALHKPGKPVRGEGDVARTALALLCFASAGYGPDHDGQYSRVVSNGLEWLASRVQQSGRFDTGTTSRWHHCYEQALGTLALAECLALKASPKLEKAVKRAVNCIERMQPNRQGDRRGWRYQKGNTDTSVTSWMILALKSAEHAGVNVNPACYDGVRRYLATVSARSGTTGYTHQGNPNQAMTATGLFLRITLGEEPTTDMNRAAARLVARNRLQVNNGQIFNLYGIYYSALAMYQVGGRQWRKFNPLIRDGLVSSQRKGDGCERGAWRGGGHLGCPVLATTFATLTLETYYRYMPVHQGLGEGEGEEELEEDELTLSAGESQLDVATIAMMDAREEGDGGALLAAEAAYSRALRTLTKEKADWDLVGEAKARLVEVAVISKDRSLTLTRVEEYLHSVPRGKKPDVRVVRLRRLERYREAMALAQKALEPDADDAARSVATAKLQALGELLAKELDGITNLEHHAECEQLLGQAQDAATRLAFAVDPNGALDLALETLGAEPKGPVSPPERRVLVGLLLRAGERFGRATKEKDADLYREAPKDMLRFDARRPRARLRRDDLERLSGLIERNAVSKAAALLALGHVDKAIRAAQSFAVRFPDSDLQPHADSVERGALAHRVQSGTARPTDRRRLADLVAKWTDGREDLPPKESLALGDLLAAAKNYPEAAKQYLRCVNSGLMDVENSARIGLAHVAISRQDFTQALGHLDAVRGEAADRLDVNMLRCQLWRAQKKPREAIREYLPMLQALNPNDPEHGHSWWEVAEAAGQAYVEAGLIDKAREFLEGVRKKDKTFGGDPKRRTRFLTLMRRLDLRR